MKLFVLDLEGVLRPESINTGASRKRKQQLLSSRPALAHMRMSMSICMLLVPLSTLLYPLASRPAF